MKIAMIDEKHFAIEDSNLDLAVYITIGDNKIEIRSDSEVTITRYISSNNPDTMIFTFMAGE